jgi:hypothetical protein
MSKFILPEYTVYFDTNAAYSPKPNEPISGGFVAALAEIRKLTGVVAKVPSVVIQELCYQRTQMALQAAENQRKNAETIKQVSGIVTPKIPDFQTLKVGCEKLLQECLSNQAIEVIEAPVQKINWQRVIESACWRRPPFEKPKSEDDLAEKGFRDSIVIESIVHDAEVVKDGTIAVLSKDKMFTAGLKNRASGIKRPLECHDACGALLTQLKLLNETQNNQFVTAVLEKVSSVFYNPEDPNCLVFAHKLLERLRQEYDEDLSQPSLLSLVTPGEISTSPGNWLSEMTEWKPLSDLKVNATAPEFIAVDDQGRYQWRSELTLARLLRRRHRPGPQAFELPEERIRVKKVDVLWSAKVDSDTAEFSDTRIDEINPQFSDEFVEATWQLRTQFDLPWLPGIDPK